MTGISDLTRVSAARFRRKRCWYCKRRGRFGWKRGAPQRGHSSASCGIILYERDATCNIPRCAIKTRIGVGFPVSDILEDDGAPGIAGVRVCPTHLAMVLIRIQETP